ncbi:hypothetical protein [Arcobacter sp. CECT 8985]|uniref:hypothetical protein n=1 Tax=Arcobacter sp. CECT 8985 TaxID=1935424 RepID=UPI00100BA936|nr:hypothetical protein [Arcobacter sp. CECT 8985]RXJ87116.1 hypothetical protein CRU93_05085 [Arcobacter sp. CECT 8985]
MKDRLHEIIAEISILHNEFIKNDKILDANIIVDEISTQSEDLQEHYLKLLLQYYFQQNDLENVKKLLLLGYKFDIRFDDIKQAFTKIVSNKENVIEFFDDAVVFVNDNNIKEPLNIMYDYYNANESNKVNLEQAVDIIRKNRYICAFCYKHIGELPFCEFFINEDLLESLKRDLPYLLK